MKSHLVSSSSTFMGDLGAVLAVRKSGFLSNFPIPVE